MLIAQLTDGYVGDEGRGRESAGGGARQLGEVAVWHEVLEGGGDADVVDPKESATGKALLRAVREFDRRRHYEEYWRNMPKMPSRSCD